MGYLKQGWVTAFRQPFLLTILFLYQLIWGLIIYRSISSIVIPLLHRYPGIMMSKTAVHLFLAESQFRILKTDITHPYLWLFLALFLIRMTLTPILNAGIYFSLHHTEYHAGYRFMRGIRKLAGPFLMYYLAQMLLTLAPLYWVWPKIKEILRHTYNYQGILMQAAPYVAGCLVYGYLVHLLFTYILFARTTEDRPMKLLSFLLRHSLSIGAVTAALLLLSFLLSLAVVSVSLIWAGFAILILYQAYRLCNLFCKLWLLSSQYQIWLLSQR